MKKILSLITMLCILTTMVGVPTFASYQQNNVAKVVGGFLIPKDLDLTAFVPSDERVEVQFCIDILCPNFIKQIVDLENILSQKCDKTTVYEVISHVKQKDVRRTYLPQKFIYDKKSQRCIWIKASFDGDISINYLTKNDSKLYSKITTEYYYDDIKFDSKKDIDKYGRMNIGVAEHFLHAVWLTFSNNPINKTEYTIYGTYPHLPKGFEIYTDIKVYKTDGSSLNYYTGNKNTKFDLTDTAGYVLALTIPKTTKKTIKSICVTVRIQPIVFKGSANINKSSVNMVIKSNPQSAQYVPTTKGVAATKIKDYSFSRVFN